MIVFYKDQQQKSIDMPVISHSFGVAFFVFFLTNFLSTLSTLSTYKHLAVIRILGLFANPKLCVIVLIHPSFRNDSAVIFDAENEESDGEM